MHELSQTKEHQKLPQRVVDKLRAAIGERNVLTEADELLVYEADALTVIKHLPAAVVLSKDAEEVSAVVKILAEENIAFTPRGAGTGLTGGSIAFDGSVIVELARLNRAQRMPLHFFVWLVQKQHRGTHCRNGQRNNLILAGGTGLIVQYQCV